MVGRAGNDPATFRVKALRVTNPALRCQSLKGNWSSTWDLHPASRPYQGRAALSLPDERVWPPELESSQRNQPSEGQCRSPSAGRIGRPPGSRTLPLPLIWKLSQAYKARPLPGAADINVVRSVGVEPAMPTPSTSCVFLFRHERMPAATSLAMMFRTMRSRVIGACCRICTHYLSVISRVHVCMCSACGMVRAAGIEPASSEFQARPSTADLHPDYLDARTGLAPATLPLCRRLPLLLGHRANWGDGMESNHLQ